MIFIPFKDYKRDIGGPSTFMNSLESYLKKISFPFTSSLRTLKKSTGIFFPISYDKYFLSFYKEKGLPIIQRLDGIYYPEKHGSDFSRLNQDIKDIYLNYSTFKIFQSEYCKKQCFEIFGEIPQDSFKIIRNGADKNIFCPKHKDKDSSIIFITTGNFRNLDMIEPIVSALDRLSDDLEFKFNVIGPVKNKEIDQLLKRPYINHIKKADLKKIAFYLQASDIFLYSHLNPPCPNSVIEAVSCGLPAVGFNSGSMGELLFFSKDLLADVSDKTFQRYEEFDPDKLLEKITKAVTNIENYKSRALEYSDLYPFDKTAAGYLEIFNKLLDLT